MKTNTFSVFHYINDLRSSGCQEMKRFQRGALRRSAADANDGGEKSGRAPAWCMGCMRCLVVSKAWDLMIVSLRGEGKLTDAQKKQWKDEMQDMVMSCHCHSDYSTCLELQKML